jgi:hypothetical protein
LPELEVALFSWMQHAENSIAVSREVLRQKADFFWRNLEVYKGLEMPKFSNGWLDNFQRRNGIQSRVKFGEAASAKDATTEMDCIRQLLSRFEPCDIFNCDETSLFWKLLPDRSLTTTKIPGRKKQRSRFTFHFCTNMDGSIKLAPWVIGTARHIAWHNEEFQTLGTPLYIQGRQTAYSNHCVDNLSDGILKASASLLHVIFRMEITPMICGWHPSHGLLESEFGGTLAPTSARRLETARQPSRFI